VQRVVNFLRGNIRLEVECAYPERFMNLCAQNDIAFWNLVRIDHITIQVTMTIKAYGRLQPLLPNLHAQVRPVKRSGVPIFFLRIRKRYALMAGFLVTLIAIWVVSLYIWDIQITGNDQIPAHEILQVMEEVGVGIGSFGPGIHPEVFRNQVLLLMDDLAWITVNINGSRATVIVRERIHPPDRVPEGVPTAVFATKSGVIDQMIIWEGAALVEIGDTVVIGQDLVSGRVESLATGTYFLRADARIYARTWYELSMSMPLELIEKTFTGRTSTKSRIFFGKSRINLYFNSGIPYETYDKMVEDSYFILPGGIVLPIRLQRMIYREYTPTSGAMDHDQAAQLLHARLLAQLEELIGPEGEILSTSFTVEVAPGLVTVHLAAECREQIAAVRRLQADEMQIFELPDEITREEINQP